MQMPISNPWSSSSQKKRQIKQGAMQELLTGKKRLPGFCSDWIMKKLGEITRLRKQRIDPRKTGISDFCIELEHIGQGTGCLVSYTATQQNSSLKSVFFKEDVLFGKLRAYLLLNLRAILMEHTCPDLIGILSKTMRFIFLL